MMLGGFLLSSLFSLAFAQRPPSNYTDHKYTSDVHRRVSSVTVKENTDGYTEFEAICNVRVIRKRPFTTATTCANYCDDNNKCQGFQISKNQCILLDKKCEAKDLIQVQNASSPAKYYLKEVACNVSATCKMASNCFAPRGFSCACWTGYCRLNQTKKHVALPNYHHYYGTCFESDLLYSPRLFQRIPLISPTDCMAKCNSDSNCVSFTIIQRFCHLNRFVCSIVHLKENSAYPQPGVDTYIKDLYHNYTCVNDEDCWKSPGSWCSKFDTVKDSGKVFCTCDGRNHECVSVPLQSGIPGILFIDRLKKLDPVRKSIQTSECTDNHICCSDVFPTPGDCSDPDFSICPKSCGQCKASTCMNRWYDCSEFKDLCSDDKVGAQVKAQCPVTCGTCGKSGKSLGISCPSSCKDQSPDCEKLSDDGQCDSNIDKCPKSCGCFKSFGE